MSGRIDIDVNEQRDPAIAQYGLSATDGARTFYYDETNNHRLVYLTEKGFNVPDPRPFVLGGIVRPGVERPIDIAELRRSMGIQPNAPELKYDMVSKGDFTTMLGSRKLGTFLDWIAREDYLLHFIALDPVYFSYVDIIDSMPEISMFDLGDRFILKNDLYRILRRDLGVTQAMLRRHSYPALADGDVRGFLSELIGLVEDGDDLLPHFNLMMLKGVLQSGRSLSSLPLLDDTPGLIMRDFASMFTHRLSLFKDGRHILDREDRVSKVLEGYRFVDAGRPLDLYRFADSMSEPGVQLADVVVGLLGACLTWLRGMFAEDVLAALEGLTPVQDDSRD